MWLIRIEQAEIKRARKELGIRIDRDRNYVRQMFGRDIYTSRKMGTRFATRKDAAANADFNFEEVVSA